MRRRNLVVPPKKNVTKERQIEGAFVKDPIIGGHAIFLLLRSLYIILSQTTTDPNESL